MDGEDLVVGLVTQLGVLRLDVMDASAQRRLVFVGRARSRIRLHRRRRIAARLLALPIEVHEAGKPPDQPATAEAQSGHADVRSRDQRVERCAEGCKRLAADCVADSGPQC
jgi:hypothetical protein